MLPDVLFVLYTVSQKVTTFKLSVTLLNLSRFLKFLHYWKVCEICYKTNIRHYLPYLRHALHYRGKLKTQIFCRYSADVEENANKLHLKCTDLNSCMRVTVYGECAVSYTHLTLPTILRV